MHTLWVRRQPPSSINELKSSRPSGHFGKPLLKSAALRRNLFCGYVWNRYWGRLPRIARVLFASPCINSRFMLHFDKIVNRSALRGVTGCNFLGVFYFYENSVGKIGIESAGGLLPLALCG